MKEPIKWINYSRAVMLTLVVSLAQGCGHEKSIEFHSPTGKVGIRVSRGLGLSGRIEIELLNNNNTELVYRTPDEANFGFAEVCWSPNEEFVGVVINGTALQTLAFSVQQHREVPFDKLRPQMESTIRSHYGVPENEGDAIAWTYSTEAQEQFSARHPDVKP